ncbi:MAG: ribosome biogenesis GTP-binding protein YihA/YsxC [Bacteroidota bacterium]
MIITSAQFVMSNTDFKKCPAPQLPEYAFIGRSNVGKSSLINMLTRQKKLAKTSETPGKTRLINHFMINESWYLVDLPGYGYAKASKTIRAAIGEIITEYLLKRPNLLNTFQLIDVRLEPQEIDLKFMEWMATKGLPFTLVFTKADKLGGSTLSQNIMNYKNHLLESWEELPEMMVTSAKEGTGQDEVLNFIEGTNEIFSPVMRWPK